MANGEGCETRDSTRWLRRQNSVCACYRLGECATDGRARVRVSITLRGVCSGAGSCRIARTHEFLQGDRHA